MMKQKHIRVLMITLILGLNLSLAWGQYSVGQSISETTRGKTVSYCANEMGATTLGDLLQPAVGEPTRVVWLNFFASW